MIDTNDVVGSIIDAANRTLRSLDQIEGLMLTVINNPVAHVMVDRCNNVLNSVSDARKEQLDIKALF